MSESVIAREIPLDGRKWEHQCARCGSSMTFEDCETCGGEGVNGHECGEDSCCCLYPEDNVECDICNGHGGWFICLSSQEYCESNPLKGRENIKRGEIEWFTLEEFPCQECGGTGGVDSGGFTPWGAPISIPCPSCELNRKKEQLK